MFVILLQAAVAHETNNAWFQWLEDQLTNIANQLPGPPSDVFKECFKTSSMKSPRSCHVDSWFQVRFQVHYGLLV